MSDRKNARYTSLSVENQDYTHILPEAERPVNNHSYYVTAQPGREIPQKRCACGAHAPHAHLFCGIFNCEGFSLSSYHIMVYPNSTSPDQSKKGIFKKCPTFYAKTIHSS